MNYSKSLVIVFAAAISIAATAGDAAAQRRGHGGGGGVAVGRATPRVGGRIYGGRVYGGRVYGGRPIFVSPRVVGVYPYRPYYYPYRRGLTIGFFAGFGYPYGYPYYGYPYYGYPYYSGYYGYGAYGGYGYGPYGYAVPPPSYVSMRPGGAYGGVRIQGAPRDGQVFVDGYYVGIVDDFDGLTQHLNLEAGAHQIEIRLPGQQPIAFDVNVQAGQTITIHAGIQ